MEIVPLSPENTEHRAAVAELLREAFPHSYGDSAEQEVASCLEAGRIALVALDDGNVVGFVGAIAQYGCTGWELHPLVVKKAAHLGGIGSRLVSALETEVTSQGGLTIYLGTDDEFGQTSLSGADLYENLWQKIADIANPGGHPYEFYVKNGYTIVGAIPDANGRGKPDILMAKRVSG
jgi:aminoglycoside 6'-N-acetyltransferase I